MRLPIRVPIRVPTRMSIRVSIGKGVLSRFRFEMEVAENREPSSRTLKHRTLMVRSPT